jgi:DNA-binding NtrC family response regulator
VDVRVIAATNHDLRAAVADKRFREDLFYRLSMVEIQVPRLADRKEDLPLLERHFITKFAAQYRKHITGLTHRAQIALAMHPWPGNVRELENVIGHGCMMATGDAIDIADLPAYFQQDRPQPAAATATAPASAAASEAPAPGIASLEDQERLLVERAMQAAGGNQSKAARILKIGRDALRYKLKKHNL